MSKRETKFNASWSDKYPWISKDKSCIRSARCTLSLDSINIWNGGILDKNQHSETAIRIKNEKRLKLVLAL